MGEIKIHDFGIFMISHFHRNQCDVQDTLKCDNGYFSIYRKWLIILLFNYFILKKIATYIIILNVTYRTSWNGGQYRKQKTLWCNFFSIYWNSNILAPTSTKKYVEIWRLVWKFRKCTVSMLMGYMQKWPILT